MDYASYRLWRDQTIARQPRVLRLDCMNPIRALAAWVGEPAAGVADAGEAAAAWSRATGELVPAEERVIARGVRDLLSAAFHTLAPGTQLWLPADVYPVYWELARAAGRQPRVFGTLGGDGWAFLEESGDQATAVLPIPLSPLGRWPSVAEVAALTAWLDGGERTLVVDAVYTYDFARSRAVLAPLVATRRCAVLWSCSKSWLRRDALGIARVPARWAETLRPMVAAPSPAELGGVVGLLAGAPGLPALQDRAFRREWQRVAPALRRADPGWQAPETGYFSVVGLSHIRLLADHQILAVPARVFGAAGDELSVVSCLHDLAVLPPSPTEVSRVVQL